MNNQSFWDKVYTRMCDLYGEEIDIGILNRYYSEKKFLAENNHEWFLDVLSNLAEDAKEHNENITALGTMGCLFVAYILGITKVNPLELHYYCPKCKKVEYIDSKLSPFDFQSKVCGCGSKMVVDGYDIPFETYNCHVGHPYVTIEVTKDYLETAKAFVSADLGREHKAISMYYGDDEPRYKLSVLPVEMDFKDIPRDPDILQSNYPCITLSASKILDAGKLLESLTSESVCEDCLREAILKETVLSGNISVDLCVYNDTVIDAIRETKPQNYFEFIKLQGLLYGVNTYNQVKDVLKSKACSLANVPAYREDIFIELCDALYKSGKKDTGLALYIANIVRKGKGQNNAEMISRSLRELGFDQTYINYVTNISFMFAKANGIAFIKRSLALIWYSIKYPEQYAHAINTIGLSLDDDE